ncbi:MAG: sulfotransferase [Anaerolineae bacterium]|nr:sulfotransferase [Anaerolineae bacterium]
MTKWTPAGLQPRSIMLISEKRSGSTIFQTELNKHPLVNVIAHTEHNDHETQYWLKAACVLGLPGNDFLHGRPPYTYADARSKLIGLLRSNVPGFVIPDDDKQLVFEGWAALCQQFGPVWFEKTPQHSQNWAALSVVLDYIHTTGADLRIIGLVRNPLGMVYSAWRSWRSNYWQRQFDWQTAYSNFQRLQHALPSEQVLLVQYEDLAQRPSEVMQRVCQFCDLPYHPDVGAGLHARSVDRWQADPAYLLQLDPDVRLLAQQFGYQAGELENKRSTLGRYDVLRRLRSLWMRRRSIVVSLMHHRVYQVLRPVVRPILKPVVGRFLK